VKALPVRDDVTAYLFEARDGSRSVAVISPHPGAKAYVPPRAVGIKVQDIWGNRMGEGQAVAETLVYVTGEVKVERLEGLLR